MKFEKRNNSPQKQKKIRGSFADFPNMSNFEYITYIKI